MWQQLVNPNPNTRYYAGYCLGFTQRVYGAPARYNTAWEAWEAVPDKHESRDIPQNVSVPIWFDHYGTYEGVTGRFGHVCAWIPGVGFLNSPGSGYGQKILPTLEATEKFYNAKFVGWSESINGLKIVQYNPEPTPEEEDMAIAYLHRDANPVKIGNETSKDGDQWLAMPGIFQHIDSMERKQILEAKIPGLRTIQVNSLELVNVYKAFMVADNA